MAKKILIIDDEPTVQKALTDKLKREGFQPISALNGKEGLEKALSEKPDLVLLDIIMPKMDGITMLKKLREDSWGRRALVLLLTVDSNPEHMSEALKDKAVDYLIKSDWKIDEVINKVKTVLGI